MQEWINNVLTTPDLSLVMLPAILLLGVLSSVASCCNIAVIGALSGYAGTKGNKEYRDILFVTISFMLGTILALVVIGAVIGYAGQVAGESLGHYGKVLAGLVSVFFGLMALNLIPLDKMKLPTFNQLSQKYPRGILGTVIFGFALGGASLSCSVSCCAPAFMVILGVASLQGQWVKSALLMGIYAVGYSMPLAAVLLGVSFGRWALSASKAMPAVRGIAGALLLVVGFYFLATV
ncbi:MAG: hypothetical protein JSU92_09265 [Deltaproteobacteria bacterium]|nr:MAG: hypothetical protein JSU92_09265 [Deltaproteobacteria bacterium]